jgi:hypothetical protein
MLPALSALFFHLFVCFVFMRTSLAFCPGQAGPQSSHFLVSLVAGMT